MTPNPSSFACSWGAQDCRIGSPAGACLIAGGWSLSVSTSTTRPPTSGRQPEGPLTADRRLQAGKLLRWRGSQAVPPHPGREQLRSAGKGPPGRLPGGPLRVWVVARAWRAGGRGWWMVPRGARRPPGGRPGRVWAATTPRAVKAPPTGGLRPALTALSPVARTLAPAGSHPVRTGQDRVPGGGPGGCQPTTDPPPTPGRARYCHQRPAGDQRPGLPAVAFLDSLGRDPEGLPKLLPGGTASSSAADHLVQPQL